MKINTLEDLINYWNSDQGKPYKGSLIDWDTYVKDPENLGCMCAQGQVLATLAHITPSALDETDQEAADIHVAEILGIPVGQAILLRDVNDTVAGAPASVLTNPEEYLGPNALKVLAFWHWLDKHRNKSVYFLDECVLAYTEKYDTLHIQSHASDNHEKILNNTNLGTDEYGSSVLQVMQIAESHYDEMATNATLELMFPELLPKQFFLSVYKEHCNDFPSGL